MMLYFFLKYLHVIGAAVLLGTGAGIAFFMLRAHLTGEPALIAAVARIVVLADFLFTATAVVAQPLTGIALAHEAGYSLGESWIVLSIILYFVPMLLLSTLLPVFVHRSEGVAAPLVAKLIASSNLGKTDGRG